MTTQRSLFQRITDVARSGSANRVAGPKWQPSVEQCVEWLHLHELTREVHTYQADFSPATESLLAMGDRIQFGVPCQRAERIRKPELDALRKQYLVERKGSTLTPAALDAVWREYKDPKSAIKALD